MKKVLLPAKGTYAFIGAKVVVNVKVREQVPNPGIVHEAGVWVILFQYSDVGRMAVTLFAIIGELFLMVKV